MTVSAAGLTSGATYYISVDNKVANKSGTFTLCLDDSGPVGTSSNDLYADAVDVTSIIGSCSEDAAYSTENATDDKSGGSCWNTHQGNPESNVWFYFTAPSSRNLKITVDRGGTKGTVERVNLAVWESDGETEITCAKYSSDGDDVTVEAIGLTAGDTYYISVDNKTASKQGTFTLCIEDLGNIYYSISDGDWDNGTTWSLYNHGDVTCNSFPIAGDIAYIQGHDVTVTGAEACDSLFIDVQTDATRLLLVNGSLTVGNNIWMENAGADVAGTIAIDGTSSLSIGGHLRLLRSGGNQGLSIPIADGGSLLVTQNFELTSNGGTVVNNTVELLGAASLSVGGDLVMRNNGSGMKTQVTANGISSISVSGNVDFDVSNDNVSEIELNNSSTLSLAGNFQRGAGDLYGTLDCNDASTLELVGSIAQQIPTTLTSNNDAFSYQNLTINNTSASVPQITLTGAFTGVVYISGVLTLTDGVVETNSTTNRLFMNNGSSAAGGSASSYISGPISKIGTDAFTFPVGDAGFYAPVSMTAPINPADYFTAQYFKDNPASAFDASQLAEGLESISTSEYWDVDRVGSSTVFLTFSIESGRSDSLGSIGDLKVAHFNGVSWDDLGLGDSTGNYAGGTIRTLTAVDDFSPFAVAKGTSSELLPVELLSFTGAYDKSYSHLCWTTASEVNNDYFLVEKSLDLVDWDIIGTVPGRGTTTEMSHYEFQDHFMSATMAYYRLKQTDFDGQYEYSPVVSITKEEKDTKVLSVFPNPAMDYVTVEISSLINVEIFNLMSQSMKDDYRIVSINAGTITFDISRLPSGVYFVRSGEEKVRFTKL